MAIVGIDLGTTNSVISIMEPEGVKVINNSNGANTTPSVVAFTDKEVLVGARAKNQAVTNPTRTINSIKRFIGLRTKEIVEAAKLVSYQMSGSSDDLVKVKIGDKSYTPQEISAKVLRDLKKSAEDYLGTEITDAVITVPAYFNDGQRQATADAGKIAGFNVRRIINEPTAAALAFGFKEADQKEQTIAVFDLGGGTFDISVLEMGGGVVEVKAINGDTFLGGDDFDAAILNYVLEEFEKTKKVNIRKDLQAMQRLREASEKAKCELSNSLISNINLPFIAQKDNTPVHLEFELSRAKFESLIKEHLKRAEKCCRSALADAKLDPKDIDDVILVGGSTRIPIVQDLVRKIFGKEPNKSVNPDEVVSVGAAIQGAILGGHEHRMVLLDVTPLSLGIETLGDRMDILIPRNSTIPTSKKDVYTTAEDGQEAVDVYVFQGERKITKYNRLLGTFRLDGIPPARRGVPRIEVSFDIDANGILKVSAKDLGTGKEQHITVEGTSGLSDEEIEKMRQDAEKHDEEDKKNLESIEVVNNAEAILLQTENGLKEFAEKLSAEEISKLQEGKDLLKKAKENGDIIEIRQNIEALMNIWHELSGRLYSGNDTETG